MVFLWLISTAQLLTLIYLSVQLRGVSYRVWRIEQQRKQQENK